MTPKELREKYTKQTGEDLLQHPDWYAWWLETQYCHELNKINVQNDEVKRFNVVNKDTLNKINSKVFNQDGWHRRMSEIVYSEPKEFCLRCAELKNDCHCGVFLSSFEYNQEDEK